MYDVRGLPLDHIVLNQRDGETEMETYKKL